MCAVSIAMYLCSESIFTVVPIMPECWTEAFRNYSVLFKLHIFVSPITIFHMKNVNGLQ